MLQTLFVFFASPLLFSHRSANAVSICDDFEQAGHTFPIYSVEGNHYEIGFQIGMLAASRIHQYISNFPDTQVLRDYILSTTEGASHFGALIENNKKLFPLYFDELKGIADGSKANLSDILALSFKHELKTLSKLRSDQSQCDANNCNANSDDHDHSNINVDPIDLGCTDILLTSTKTQHSNDDFVGIVHNEDGWDGIKNTGYYVNATYRIDINNDDHSTSSDSGINPFAKQQVQSIFSFAYPGTIIGMTYAMNNFGLITTVNALFPKKVNISPNARAIYFLERQLLDCDSIECCLNCILKFNTDDELITDFGASVNIAQKRKVIISRKGGYEKDDNDDDLVKFEHINVIDIVNIEFVGNKYSIVPLHTILHSDGEPDIKIVGDNVEDFMTDNSFVLGTNLDDIKFQPNAAFSYHFNKFLRIDNDNEFEFVDESSLHRQETMKHFLKNIDFFGLSNALDFAGDTSDNNYPVYRTREGESVYDSTIATAVFDVKHNKLIVYHDCNPKECQPNLCVNIP